MLGICYGMQLIAHHLGGKVDPGAAREYGPALLSVRQADGLFEGLDGELPVWMSHGDHVTQLPPGFHSLASSGNSPVAAFADDRGVYGIQFHPEVVHTPSGREVLRNFLYRVCRCEPTWNAGSFIAEATETIRAQVGAGRVICALSGGVDSAVAATLVQRAVGDQLTCVFVNNGLLRKEEPERVLAVMHGNLDMNIRYVDATERFLHALKGVIDPEEKRRIDIGPRQRYSRRSLHRAPSPVAPSAAGLRDRWMPPVGAHRNQADAVTSRRYFPQSWSQ